MHFQGWCRDSTVCLTFLYHLLSHFSMFSCHLKATGRLLRPHPSHLYSSRDEGGKDFYHVAEKIVVTTPVLEKQKITQELHNRLIPTSPNGHCGILPPPAGR